MTSLTCCGGFVDSGVPQGTEEKYAGINCYVAPKDKITNNTTAIILATDVFGYTLPNARLIADSFAKNASVLIIVPDLFELQLTYLILLGGRIAVYLGQKSDVIDAFCAAHPGGLAIPGDFEKLVKPACFVLPENDHEIKEKQIATIREILQKKEGTLLSRVKDYPDMIHGFAVRGNENDEAVKTARIGAFEFALAFFKQALEF